MKLFILPASLLFLAFTSASPLRKRDYPAVGACSGQCSGRLHDPSVVYRADTKTYYRFATNDGINTATAPSLSGPWTFKGPAMPDGSSINLPGNHDLWAPDVFLYKGTYYLTYSVSAMGSQNSDLGIATSSTMDPGSWTDHGSLGVPKSANYNKIDGNIYYPTGAPGPVLNFGSFWQNIFQIPLSNPPLSVSSPTVTHLAQNTTTRPAGLVSGSMEGSYMFNWQGYSYLFFSSGNCCNEPPNLAPQGEEYHIMVCRSSSESSGFVDQQGRDCLTGNGGTMVLGSHDDVYAPGGQGVMWDENEGSVVVYYHYVRPSLSYDYDSFFFGWNKLDFGSGWPVVVS